MKGAGFNFRASYSRAAWGSGFEQQRMDIAGSRPKENCGWSAASCLMEPALTMEGEGAPCRFEKHKINIHYTWLEKSS
jgi:hypothetical protein